MITTTQKRWALWSVLLAVAAWLAVFGNKTPPDADPSIAAPVARAVTDVQASLPAPDPTPAPAAAALTALIPRASLIRSTPAEAVDLFGPRSWAPPPVAATPAPPAAPTAPALPFIYVGKKQQAGQWEVYLSQGEETVIARQGTNLQGTYVVERIEPPTMTFKYLPLGQRQDLSIGD